MNSENSAPCLVIDFIDQQGLPERRIFTNPLQVFAVDRVDEVQAALVEIERLVDEGHFAVGYLSYEAAPAFDSAYEVATRHTMPLLWFGIFDEPAVDSTVQQQDDFHLSPWQADTNHEAYVDNIATIKQLIATGETYQVNYTLRLQSQFAGDDFGLYERLRIAQPTAYSAYLNIGRFRILSVSPELFFTKSGSTIATRPMKGTMKRGRWLQEDELAATMLATSLKDRAENVMIVDLLRNDLSRIPGVTAVEVPQLCTVESYPTVYQMTSTVTAQVPAQTSFMDVLKALFPCGSITGAPKISTMHIIAAVEPSPRDIYCGTIGIIEPNGDAMFNVAIRTLLIDCDSGVATYGVGGGITWDSSSAGEYAEVWAKASILQEANEPFALLETMKLSNGHYVLLPQHLARLTASAQYFGIELDSQIVKMQLDQHASRFGGMNRRVRLLVSQRGKVHVESTVLVELSGETQRVALARTPIAKSNRFLYHKTTRREVYEQHRARQPDVFDVLLWNESGLITEFTNGNIVLEINGSKVTPARECGVLAGTLRAALLDEGAIVEAELRAADIARAQHIWFINSVRGWVPVEFA